MGRVLITNSQPEDWVYISEGGATIVFSYKGSPNPDFSGRVLRLRKTPRLDTVPDVSHTSIGEEEPDDPSITFLHEVISHFVPGTFLPDLDVVLLDPAWLDVLEQLRDHDRPPERRKKDKIDKWRRKGVLATDLIGGQDTMAIEIKVGARLIMRIVISRMIVISTSSPSGVSCRIHGIYHPKRRRSRCRHVDSACTRILGRHKAMFRLNIVPWTYIRMKTVVSRRRSMICGSPGSRAIVL